MPIVDYLASIWNCSDNTHIYFTSMQCWSGMHIVYAISSLFVIIIFLVLCFIITMTFYDCRMNSSDPTAKVNGRSGLLFQFYQLLMVLVLNIIKGDQFIYIHLVLIFGGSTLIFISFAINEIFHHQGFQYLHATSASVTMWTAIMLVLAKLMEG